VWGKKPPGGAKIFLVGRKFQKKEKEREIQNWFPKKAFKK